MLPTALIGRQAELADLASALTQAFDGHGSVALVVGEAGIGKTRLAEELASIALGRGGRVWWSRCYDGQGAPAFWPWLQLIRAALGGADGEAVRARIGPNLIDLSPLVPGLAEPTNEVQVESAEGRFRLFEAVGTALAALAFERPQLLIVDDLHWADPPSLQLLEFLGPWIASQPMLLLCTLREGETNQALSSTLGRLARLPNCVHVALRGLRIEQTAAMVGSLVGGPVNHEWVAAIHRACDGNPFYVGELVRLLAREQKLTGTLVRQIPVPPRVRDVIELRLGRVSKACRELLALAAVIGPEFDLAALAAADGRSLDELLPLISAAETAGLVRADVATLGRRYEFSHALVRDALYAAVPRATQMVLHLQVGTALEPVWASDPDHVAELAYHLIQAAPSVADVSLVQRAVAYAEQGAERATRVFAHESAAELYELALQGLACTPVGHDLHRCRVLIELGGARMRSSDLTLGRAALTEAAQLARRLLAERAHASAAAVLLGRAVLDYGGTGMVLGPAEPTQLELMHEALAALGDTHAPGEAAALRARLLARLSLALYWTPQRERSLPLSHDAMLAARESGDARALVAALRVRRYVLGSPRFLAQRRELTQEVVQLAESLGDPELMLLSLRGQIVDSIEVADAAGLDAAVNRYIYLADNTRQAYYHWYAMLLQAMRAMLAGQSDLGIDLATRARTLGRRAGDRDAEMFFTLQVFDVWLERGMIADLIGALEALVDQYPAVPSLRCRLAALYAQLGRADVAQHMLPTADLPDDVNWLPSVAYLAQACILTGNRARGEELYATLAPYAGRNMVTAAGIVDVGPTDWWLGRLALLLGDAPRARMHLECAIALATRMGARGQVQAIAAELDALDRQPLAKAVAGLTPRELEVLRLLAQGKSNREIADQLVLSVKTVMHHSVSIYRKLDVSGRAGATAFAVAKGLTE